MCEIIIMNWRRRELMKTKIVFSFVRLFQMRIKPQFDENVRYLSDFRAQHHTLHFSTFTHFAPQSTTDCFNNPKDGKGAGKSPRSGVRTVFSLQMSLIFSVLPLT